MARYDSIVTSSNVTVITANVDNTTVIVVGSVDANNNVSSINSLTIDYTAYYMRIASAMESLVINSSIIANNTTILANNSNNILTHVASIDASLANIVISMEEISTNNNMIRANTEIIANSANTLRILANTTGIRMVSPYEEFGGVSMYQYMIEQGKALNSGQTDIVDQETQNRAKTAVLNYRDKLRDFSKF